MSCCNLEMVGKVCCIVLILLQGAVLDYYLAVKHASKSLGFIATDIVVVIVWIAVVFVAKRRCHIHMKLRLPRCPRLRMRWKGRDRGDRIDAPDEEYPDELPYAFIAWFAYTAITLVPEIVVIFKNFADELEDVKILGQNVLKVALCITPMLFLLLVNSHHNTKQSARKWYIDKLTGGVTLDLMDSIDILEVLFLKDAIVDLPVALENIIIAFACINFFLPTLALLELSVNKFDGQVRSVSFQILYSLSYIGLVNVPFWIIRVYIWWVFSQDVSVFIAKNIIMTVIYSMDIYESLTSERPRKCEICGNSFLKSCFEDHINQCKKPESLTGNDQELQQV
ncbi:uncharacterized protein LOC5504945 [Nematostella vectensis]|uniref:uncharacterized protein LOC5504945 n=1 Tax=Nematostella vectensis TaxID=45351 RepID=UPI0020773DFF|nr:uncharacterized protein LOC5504945 [Nematostella vectensis]